MNRILIATDGSAGGRSAVATGVSLARSATAAVTIAYVRHVPSPIVGDPFYQRALSAETETARTAVDDATLYADEAGVENEVEILDGDPAEKIVELARVRDVDLIVVGARPLGPVAKALLGSVSSAIVHHADRPVLVVNERSALAARRAA